MAEISKEVDEQGRKAYENQTDYYTVEASGNTFPVKDEFISWAFFWNPERKVWINECASEFEKFLFERMVIDGGWRGVILTFTNNHLEEWEKNI